MVISLPEQILQVQDVAGIGTWATRRECSAVSCRLMLQRSGLQTFIVPLLSFQVLSHPAVSTVPSFSSGPGYHCHILSDSKFLVQFQLRLSPASITNTALLQLTSFLWGPRSPENNLHTELSEFPAVLQVCSAPRLQCSMSVVLQVCSPCLGKMKAGGQLRPRSLRPAGITQQVLCLRVQLSNQMVDLLLSGRKAHFFSQTHP